MLEIVARDGAGRIGILRAGERTIDLPSIFWHRERLPSAAAEWGPTMARAPDDRADLVVATRFTDAAPSGGEGRLVFQRRLAPTAAMTPEKPLLETLGEAVTVWVHAYDLLKEPKRFAEAVVRARREAGFHHALYAPGLGEVHNLALLAYAGVDLFDATPLHLAASQGLYLTSHGRFEAKSLEAAECECPACQGEAPSAFTEKELSAHNQYAARMEIGAVRNAIRNGRLRELVEGRARSHPEATALLRRLDSQFEYFEERAPLNRPNALWANTKESLQRVECRRFRTRVAERYRPPKSPPVLLLLPCSHRKPYSRSRTHRAVGDAVWNAGAAGLVHEVIVTSPLGVVPRELELCYPAQHYDVPVTGEWDEEEGVMIRELLSRHLAKRPYDRVVSHLPKHTYELVRTLLPAETLVTCEGENATAPEALQRLELTLRKLGTEHSRANLQQLSLERLQALSDYQFGPEVTDVLFKGVFARGKWPTGQIVCGREIVATLPTERGLLSLTLEGGHRLLSAGHFRVGIDDFEVKGSVFAVGVQDADAEIRPGDEVVLHHDGKIKGIGVAQMSGTEMVQVRRGEAVKVRHHA